MVTQNFRELKDPINPVGITSRIQIVTLMTCVFSPHGLKCLTMERMVGARC